MGQPPGQVHESWFQGLALIPAGSGPKTLEVDSCLLDSEKNITTEFRYPSSLLFSFVNCRADLAI